jgi:Ca2+-binding RTX toxin-like protein
MLAMGNEIGNHSYTHLANPPAGSPTTYAENTTYLNTTGTGPWTFDYEFNQSKTIEQQNIGSYIAGAAVPGMPETLATAEQIMQYYQSVAGGAAGYISGGWTGVGSGYPNAFGYMSPADTGSVYLAPNMTFDFTEVEFEKKTVAQALADWIAQFDKLSANSDVPVIVWPWHDYGATAWDATGTGAASPYTTQMYTDFITYAFSKNFEFVTEADLAARISAQQKAVIKTTTTGAAITVSVTPDPSAPDLGHMALDVVNGGAQVIQNVANWYAYDGSSVFLPKNGGSFVVNLGAAQDDVTHITSLPMRADLLSVSGDGSNLKFSIAGDGNVVVDLHTPGAQIVSVQGAPGGSLSGALLDQLTLAFSDGALAVSALSPTGVAVQHDVTITEGAAAVSTTGADLIFGGSANDVLNGGGGDDYLNGGGGVNTAAYTGLISDYQATTNADGGLTLHDLRAGSPDGTDIDVNIQNFQFGDGLIASAAQLTGTGVSAGTAGNDSLTSAVAGQLILGLAGNDTLTAGAINQTLDGGPGANILNDGGATIGGVATMIGGADNDTYIVTKATDVIIEHTGGGTDTVRTTLNTYTLPANVENLTFTGAGSFTGVGNDLGDVITGGAGKDQLTGGAGNDIFTGGAKSDTFVFKTVNPVAGNVGFGADTIKDFTASGLNHDILVLPQTLFTSAAAVLALAHQSGADTVITIDSHDSITLTNVLLSTLKQNASADIHFA